MTLDNLNEERVREAFAVLTDASPIGVEFEELGSVEIIRPRTIGRPIVAFVSALLVVTLLGVLGVLLFSSPQALPEARPAPSDVAGDPADLPGLLPPDRPVFDRPLDLLPPTFEEYREVAEWTVACIEAVGVEVVDFGTADVAHGYRGWHPGFFPSDYFSWLTGEVDPNGPAGSADHATAYCKQWSNYDNVFNAYINNPTQEQLDDWHDSIRVCIDGLGIAFSDVFEEPTVHDGGLVYPELKRGSADVPTDCWP